MVNYNDSQRTVLSQGPSRYTLWPNFSKTYFAILSAFASENQSENIEKVNISVWNDFGFVCKNIQSLELFGYIELVCLSFKKNKKIKKSEKLLQLISNRIYDYKN